MLHGNDDDRYIKEDPFADIIMGLTSTIRRGAWDISMTARASIGNYAYNNVASNAVLNNAWNSFEILNNIHSDYLTTGFEFTTEDLQETAKISDEELDEVAAGTGKNYLVQYKESDLNFVDRLAEHEGISYYFQNSNSENRMLLAKFHSPSLKVHR